VHATLVEALGAAPGHPPVERMAARFEAAVTQVPGLAEWADEVRRVYEAADRVTGLQRVHGDLHLGQVLRTQDTWLLIDFEGEPGSPVDERRAPDSPLRDVAGMLRSFDYASHQLLVDDPDDDALEARAAAWTRHNTDAFCAGYAAVAGSDPRDQSELLRAYEVDKLVYEASYESRYRPAWAWIPMRTFDRVLRPVGGPPLPRAAT
jgi:maltokinase